MENIELTEAVQKGNKWWKEKFELEFKHREIYDKIKRFLHTRQIIAITGLRRTGKTTIMLKLIADLIGKYKAENILYFSFDDFKEEKLTTIIKTYERLMNKDTAKGNYLILFDEIQKVNGWEEQIKRIYDSNKGIKLFISGSESLFIRKKLRENLSGRMFEFHVKTLNFREYLLFKNKTFDNINLYKEEILREFNSFLYCSGFPEIINENKEIIEKYLVDNVIDKMIYKDMAQIFYIKEPAILEQIFKIILNDPGQIINIEGLANESNISRQTASLYLDYLEKAFLIKKVYAFSRNARKTQRRLKKYYPLIFLPNLVENPEKFGKIFETSMILHLNADFFWRDTYKNEVDAVIVKENKIIPIEIKSGKIDCKALKLFMKIFNLNHGMVLSYQQKDVIKFDRGEIEIIPFYEYFLNSNDKVTDVVKVSEIVEEV